MSQHRVRLIEDLVYSHFGSAVGEVASLLLNRGALPLSILSRLSSLPMGTVECCNFVLSSHSCLYRSETELNGRLTELYELNTQGVENRMRGGLYLMAAQELEQKHVGYHGLQRIIQSLWREGMLRMDELMKAVARSLYEEKSIEIGDKALEEQSSFGRKNTKGKQKASARPKSMKEAFDIAQLTIWSAIAEGYISVVTPVSQMSSEALQMKWEAEARERIVGIPTPKELRLVSAEVTRARRKQMRRERLLARGYNPSSDGESEEADSDKIVLTGREQRIHYGFDENRREGRIVAKPPTDTFLRYNPERFHIMWRKEILVDFVSQKFNQQCAAIFSAIMDHADASTRSISQRYSEFVALSAIMVTLKRNNEFGDLIFDEAFPSVCKRAEWTRPKRTRDLVSEICSVLAEGNGTNRPRCNFLLQKGEGDAARWAVKYEEASATVQRALVEAIISKRLGRTALLCWRILEDKGKLEEKHLARLAFLSVKDAREVIARLSSDSLIEPQEVPRSADRAPSRTIFLWYVDYPKVVTTLLDHHYKALANLQSQKAHQLQAKEGLVQKRERIDVEADPDRLLSARDKALMMELDKVMEAMTVAELRIDRDVFILRDISVI